MGAAAAAGASEAAAAAGAAGGGGGSPVSFEAKLDLTEAYNRLQSSWYNIFTGTSQVSMPAYGCAYPGEFRDEEIREIAQYTRPESVQLVWEMAMDTLWPGDEGRYKLYCDFEGRYYESSGGFGYYFLENVNAWVDFYESGYGWKLYVDAAFEGENFYDGIANMIIDFHVKETDGGDDVHRDTHRKFRIYADGRKEKMF